MNILGVTSATSIEDNWKIKETIKFQEHTMLNTHVPKKPNCAKHSYCLTVNQHCDACAPLRHLILMQLLGKDHTEYARKT